MLTKPPTAKTRIQAIRSYPILILLAYLPPLLYTCHASLERQDLINTSLKTTLGQYHAFTLFFTVVACLLLATRTTARHALPILSLFYYFCVLDWFSWQVQYKPFFIPDIYRAIQLALYYPEFISQLGLGLKLKLAILLAYPPALWAGLNLPIIRQSIIHIQKPLGLFSYSALGIFLLATPWFASSTYLKQNPVTLALSEQLREFEIASAETHPASIQQLLGASSTNGNPLPTPDARTKPNILLFIIETTPYPDYPRLEALAKNQTGTSWLSNNAVYFDAHYTTYPSSDRANYSIVSGLYPPMYEHNHWKGQMHYPQSLPKALAGHGYKTFVFSTAPTSFYDDDSMYHNLGVEQVHDVGLTKQLRTKTANGYEWDRAGIYKADEQLIRDTIAQLQKHLHNQPTTPFLAFVQPQASHAPFQCPPDTPQPETACHTDHDKIAANASWQFKLLGELLHALNELHQLDNLILIVTGDHGLRSQQESPLFHNPNLLQENTFHVPFLIAADNIQNPRRTFNHPTSHIDIAPTILNLLGLPQPAPGFHGRNLFAPLPRTLFFIGSGYLPANGFLQNGVFYMENRYAGLELSSPTFDFSPGARNQSQPDNVQGLINNTLVQIESYLRKEYNLVKP